MASLKLIYSTIEALCVLGGDKQPILDNLKEAQEALEEALKGMDELTVSGRGPIDTLLGCILETEAIVGEEEDNG